MYTLYWKNQNSESMRAEDHTTIHTAIQEFRNAMTGLYAHSGGRVVLVDQEISDVALLTWEEHCAGAYCAGQAVEDYREELCEDCEREVLEQCFDRLERDYK